MTHPPQTERRRGRLGPIRRITAGVVATLLASAAALALVVGTIGPPLAGRGVFLTTDLVYLAYPWRAITDPAGMDPLHGGPTSDTVDAVYPARSTFAEDARDGEFAAWNPFVGGGEPFGATSNAGQLNPLAFPYLFAPGWLAPALVKLAGLATAIGFTYLFCRRLGAGQVAAIAGGVVYAASGFVVMWTNWAQADVAALIPAVFWAIERFLQRRTASSAVPIALALAAMLLAMFPAVVGFTLSVLACYVLARLVAGARGTPVGAPEPEDAGEAAAADEPDGAAEERVRAGGARWSVRDAAVGGAGVAAGLAAGVLLAAAILLPFAAQLRDTSLDRAQGLGDYVGIPSLITTVAPAAMGLSTTGVHYFGPSRNQVESTAYIGVVGVLLALAAVALPRGRTPRGAIVGLALPTALLGVATYAGGPLLSLLQRFPVYGTNYIGRAQSVLGFAVAALAAVGLQALIDHDVPSLRRLRSWDWMRIGAVALASMAFGGFVYFRARAWAANTGHSSTFGDAVGPAKLIALVAVAAIVGLVLTRGAVRSLVAAGLVVLASVQALTFTVPLLPNESRDTLYPETPGLAFLEANLGHDRVAAEGQTFYGNGAMVHRIRNAGGHSFFAPTWKDMLAMASPGAFRASPTLANLSGAQASVASAIYDRMGVRFFASTPSQPPYGAREALDLASGRCEGAAGSGADGGQGDTVARSRVPAGVGLRGIVVRVCENAQLPQPVTVDVRATAGAETATGRVRLRTAVPAGELALPVTGDDLANDVGADGTIDLTVRLRGADGALPLAADDGDLAADLIRPSDDGLALVFADDLRIYERTRALPRIRWAGRSQVITDPAERVRTLAEGDVPDDTVVLSEGAAGGSGSDGRVEVLDDGDAIRVDVDAEGAGYVVVADGLQHGWSATVDGAAAELVAADHSGVAVAVPEGRHTVELRYRPDGQRAGLAISAVTAAGLCAVGLAPLVRARRNRRTPREPVTSASGKPEDG